MATSEAPGHAADEPRVTNLELFFDLVFVFAITQVTGLLAAEPTWRGLVRGLLVLTALWWGWVGFSWLTNTVNPEEGAVRLAVFGVMAALLVASLAVPGAFGDDALVFGLAYLFVRTLHVVLYDLAARGDPGLRRAVWRLAPGVLGSPVLILAAAARDGVAQGALWVVALAIDLLSPVVAGSGGWRLSPGHFAERHGLFIIIALGEAIVAIGAGAAGLHVGPALAVAAVLTLAVAAGMWWAYFDVVALVAERRLAQEQGAARVAMARDSYSYLHLPMVAGIVLFALGVKKVLGHLGDPLHAVPAVALCGGVALYLAGHVAFRLRNVHTLNRQRVVALLACLAVIPLATSTAGLAALACLAGIVVALIAYEAIHLREARRRVRLARA